MTIKENITTINQFEGRFGKDIKYIVLHSSWGTARGSVQWFKNPKAQASANYVISKTGEITLCVPEKNASWSVGLSNQELSYALKQPKVAKMVKDNINTNLNWISLSVEMEDNRNRNWSYPDLQYKACVELTADICKRYKIKVDREYVVLHKEINPLNRTDPVGKWDHDKFVNDVAEVLLGGGEKDKFYVLETVVSVRKGIDLNIRPGPYRSYKVTDVLRGGTEIEVLGFVEGEEVEKVNKWWKTKQGNYVWSGGTDRIPKISDLPPSIVPQTVEKENMERQEWLDKKAKLEARKAELDEAVAVNTAEMTEFATVPEPAEVVEVVAEVAPEPVAEVPAPEVVAEPVVEATPEVADGVIAPDPDLKAEVSKLESFLAELKAKLGM